METSVNYNRMTTIFFISGIIVMASLYTALPLTSVFAKDFGISNAVAITKWCDLFIYVFNKLSILWYNFWKIWTYSYDFIWTYWTRHYMFTYRLHSFVHTTYYSSCNSRYMCGSFFTCIYYLCHWNIFTSKTCDCD